MRVCVVGSGGREHALSRAIGRRWHDVCVVPGNPGIPVSIPEAVPEDVEADLYVIGPEAPLIDGLADRLRSRGRKVLGPGADGARLEGSKAWMKQLLINAGIPTADYMVARQGGSLDEATAFIRRYKGSVAVKTSYLAGGKGSREHSSVEEALADLVDKLKKGDVVVEERLFGIFGQEEASVFALCDGTKAAFMGTARDYKKLRNGNQGPNTGGMGAYSPVPEVDVGEVMRLIMQPILDQLIHEGIDYRGVLFAGLMLTPAGPKVLEFNIRLGDPETQALLALITSDVAQHFLEAAEGNIRTPITFSEGAAVTVVMAAEDYPATPRTGDVITGLGGVSPWVNVDYAGVGRDDHWQLITAGGRVVSVTVVGQDLAEARKKVYAARASISWPGMQARDDIAESV